MSKSRAALTARNRRKSSLVAFSHKLIGGAAIACLIGGCAVTVYTKIIAADAYPTLGSIEQDEPVVRPTPRLVTRNAADAVGDAFSAFPETPAVTTVAAITPQMFNDRFGAAVPQGVASNAAAGAPPLPRLAEAAPPKLLEAPKAPEAPRVAEAPKKDARPPMQLALANTNSKPQAQPATTPAQAAEANAPKNSFSLRAMTERAKAAVLSIAGERHSIQEKLWGKPESQDGGLLAYASADSNITASIAKDPTRGGRPPYDLSTAVYDISAKAVYLPDGTKLEAHSGLGDNLDKPSSEKIKMRGVTPPHIYELKPREALFHGVPALRLNPIGGEDAIHGRNGLLAHTFMLGPNGDSNGCVSFRDYYAFLDAYKNKGIRKLAVLARID
ncbi:MULTISPECIES: tlde1 domain-containing protein [unclassified Bradyrhizobium]|uniref:tlde1 domain-containing protein n=1 Tax=unclassified Bradyrhizobium TaxID=2631580 RepID=UPI0028E32665|nr:MULTISPECIES: tlde1 domain-containing protein [unclassified Bradyrhizobium]